MRKAPEDPVIYNRIREVYDTIYKKLQGSITDNSLIAFEASTLLDALNGVFEELGNTNKAEEEVKKIMKGKVLSFTADQYFYDGKNEGRKEGRKEGAMEILASLVKEGILTESDAAARLKMTEDEFHSAMESAS